MAYQPAPGARRPRNPHTQAQIRRDLWLQIVAPLALATLVLIVLMVLIIAPAGAPVRSPLADVALILLIMPALLVGLIALAVIAGLTNVLYLGITRLPPYFKIAQDYVALAAGRIQDVIQKASNAVISTRGLIAAAQRAVTDLGTLLPFHRRT